MYRSSGGSHYEQLETFIDQGYITEVLGLVKSGKEASVYFCEGGEAAGADFVAAKVFRGRQYRFKNDAVYQQSRDREMGIRGRALRAMQSKGSSFGRQVAEGSWHLREYETLQLLHDAGGMVPRPIAADGDVILMEYFGDEEEAAYQLSRVDLDDEEAPELFRQLMDFFELMLRCNRVHGDLSPHNVLYWEGELKVIDFPQASDPRFNPAAQELLRRDIENICRYFRQYGVESEALRLADDLWFRFRRAEL
jgi:RIO kinase 1